MCVRDRMTKGEGASGVNKPRIEAETGRRMYDKRMQKTDTESEAYACVKGRKEDNGREKRRAGHDHGHSKLRSRHQATPRSYRDHKRLSAFDREGATGASAPLTPLEVWVAYVIGTEQPCARPIKYGYCQTLSMKLKHLEAAETSTAPLILSYLICMLWLQARVDSVSFR